MPANIRIARASARESLLSELSEPLERTRRITISAIYDPKAHTVRICLAYSFLPTISFHCVIRYTWVTVFSLWESKKHWQHVYCNAQRVSSAKRAVIVLITRFAGIQISLQFSMQTRPWVLGDKFLPQPSSIDRMDRSKAGASLAGIV